MAINPNAIPEHIAYGAGHTGARPIARSNGNGSCTHLQPPLRTALEALYTSSIRIADRAVITDIETEAIRVGPSSARTYDVRVLLDEREQPAELVDMYSEALAYALARGIVVRESEAQPWLVRIVGCA